MTPKFVADILKSAWLWHLSRLLVTFMYWYAGVGFALNFGGAEGAMGLTGLQPHWLIALLTIAVEVIGSLLVIFDRGVWFGAGMLGVFTLLTVLLVHPFWAMSGAEAAEAVLESEEHLTVIGGLLAVSILSLMRREWNAQRS